MTSTIVEPAATPTSHTGAVLAGSTAAPMPATQATAVIQISGPAINTPLVASVPPAWTATVSSSPAAAPAAAAAGPSTVGAWIAFVAVLLAAAIVAAWNVWLARRRSREEERGRQRTAFAEAFKTYARYRELPYAIRRRRADDDAAERVRLSEIAREVQAELTYHQTWMDLENADVAAAYRALITELRKVAGGHMRQAWTLPAIASDREMNMMIEMDSLAALETDYLDKVRRHLLRLAPWWYR